MLDLNSIDNMSKAEFDKLNIDEQKLVLTILEEISRTGKSQTLKDIWYTDYTEVPVSITEFITNPYYLGNSTREGTSIYPYWRNKYKEIFDASLGYEEIILTGAIGVGKTRTAVVCLAYMLYKLMCLKNPQEYFKFNEGDMITIFFLNISLRLAEGVGYMTLHDYLLHSPWFMERGTQSGRKNLLYNPPNHIGITFGSKSDHALGQQVYCLKGDTQIYTEYGVFPIEELENTHFRVYAYDKDTHKALLSNTVTVLNTATVSKHYRLEFSNGVSISCTDNHMWLMTNGKYKRTDELGINDRLQFVGHNETSLKAIHIITSENPIKFYDVINVNYYHNFIVKCGDSKLVSHNCLHPDTEIPTTDGVYKISELEDKTFKVYTYDINKKEVIISNETTAVNTITTNDYYEIELENGSIIKCTGNHLFLLKTGEYKRADELTEEDELEDISPNKLF